MQRQQDAFITYHIFEERVQILIHDAGKTVVTGASELLVRVSQSVNGDKVFGKEMTFGTNSLYPKERQMRTQ